MTHIPRKAIEKAIEGGWQTSFDIDVLVEQRRHPHLEETIVCSIVLDPSFWQSLGIALGWKRGIKRGVAGAECIVRQDEWYEQAHRFYDLILAGGDAQKFWDGILAASRYVPKLT